jgi:hypothetical protein
MSEAVAPGSRKRRSSNSLSNGSKRQRALGDVHTAEREEFERGLPHLNELIQSAKTGLGLLQHDAAWPYRSTRLGNERTLRVLRQELLQLVGECEEYQAK